MRAGYGTAKQRGGKVTFTLPSCSYNNIQKLRETFHGLLNEILFATGELGK